ncbi:MAG: cobalamin-dependent protein, partial [Phycisphaerales bacterium]
MSRNSGKCRVVLLNPPTASPATTVLLNLAYLSAVLKDGGHQVLLLDETAPHRPLTESEVEQRIRAFDPHFIGVTMTITYIVET